MNIVRRAYAKAKRMISSNKTEPVGLSRFLSHHEILRLRNLPRKMESSATIFSRQINFPDGFWFLHSLEELFVEEVYKFENDSPNPLIIDCGSNIGLSIIYFKKLFPSATILGFEPDASIFQLLTKNVNQFNFTGVSLLNYGVWNQETTLSFLAEGTLGGKVINQKADNTESFDVVTIKTKRLKDYLQQKVDFLKIDIEGAEYEVIIDCASDLQNVKFLFVEYHSTPTAKQRLNEILTVISDAGFRYYIKEASLDVKYPFIDNKSTWFDLQLNIFCYRK
jgi:FkbM family methyltransferase